MRIETVDAEDAFELETLMVKTIKASVPIGEAEMREVIGNVTTNLRWALANAAQCVHLTCVDGERIVGTLLVKNFWNLCSLFIDADFQRKGMGRSLMTEAIEQCVSRGTQAHMKVNAAPNAIGFYQSIGFTVSEDLPRRGTSTPMILPLERP